MIREKIASVSRLNPFDFFQVTIEYGLCEMLNREAIRPNVAPKDGNFDFNISELEALLPAGTVDHAVEKVYPEVRTVNLNFPTSIPTPARKFKKKFHLYLKISSYCMRHLQNHC